MVKYQEEKENSNFKTRGMLQGKEDKKERNRTFKRRKSI
jgi:hypothetical protein